MAHTTAIHQPNYLPWIGYFHKMLVADTFVYLDTVEFNSDWVTHRNKIKTNEGEHWLTVPIASSSSTEIRELEIDTTQKWQHTHKKSLEAHYAGADYFDDHRELVEVYEEREWSKLAPLNKRIIDLLVDALDLDVEFVASSELPVEGSGTELLVDVCEAVDTDTYFSGAGGKEYHDESQFEQAGIDIVYQDVDHPEYPQQLGEFVSHLSFIDALFNVGGEEARSLLEEL